ncbi:hypothetical protein AAU61_20575 [Desulfocarbo indianensis]|nr:hypothetical protein AAU61_20575 [Desulfocarbo indianensis]
MKYPAHPLLTRLVHQDLPELTQHELQAGKGGVSGIQIGRLIAGGILALVMALKQSYGFGPGLAGNKFLLGAPSMSIYMAHERAEDVEEYGLIQGWRLGPLKGTDCFLNRFIA